MRNHFLSLGEFLNLTAMQAHAAIKKAAIMCKRVKLLQPAVARQRFRYSRPGQYH